MPEHQAVDIEHVPIVTPPPYMDPANAQAKKKMSRIRKESVSNMKPCQHCGAPPQAQAANLPHEQVLIWPAARPTNHIHQDSRQFIGYVLIIAIVIFLLFAACKYLP
ncbi:LITAF domain-containing protein [Caenorhabditis elegans]|uniref:LITAF domain-containing protein n=1 Tax=Caenorhabditis elegans TaxID=6239 RepID=F5GUG4_CAEEL|nr:LITAF domain-containing protein [Caenorhabditis elegans]CCA65608.1 LITAF domain-containing protein [Caenorhabditis elegans]|eukprot:NP_001256285.1 Uncharacterized protein CELE_T04C12.11 [Caenorhabditis elegans]